MDQFTVAVIVEEKLLKVTSDGTEKGSVFTGTPDHIERLRSVIHCEHLIEVETVSGPAIVKAGYESPLALLVALYSIAPEETTLWEAPADLLTLLSLPASNVNPDGLLGEPVCDKPKS
jgi:hypothetical protein